MTVDTKKSEDELPEPDLGTNGSSDVELTGDPILDIPRELLEKIRRTPLNGSVEAINTRLSLLQQVVGAFRIRNGRHPDRDEIIAEMAKFGVEYTYATLFRDRGRLKARELWLSSIFVEGTYSAYQSDSMELLDRIEREAKRCYEKKWTNSKSVKHFEGPAFADKKTGRIEREEIIIADETPQPKVQFLNILLKTAELRMKLFSGDNIDLASAILCEEFDELKQKSTELERKNREIERELKLARSNGNADLEQENDNTSLEE